MIRLVAIVVLAWGLVSCQSDMFAPDGSPEPTVPPPPTVPPGRPSPTIEIPPPI